MSSLSSNEAFEALKVFLVENYGAKLASGGKEITKRCHICGDSHDKSARHMYIGLKDGVIVYNCFRCPAKGVVDSSFFRDIGCYDINMITLCNENNAKNANYRGMLDKKRFIKKRSPILTYRNALETEKKVAYISNRLGHDFSLQELANLKIIPNLYDFINANTVGTITRHKNVCDELDMFFLGFLSLDNAFINMKRLVPEGKVNQYIDTKYVNYNIYGFHDNSARYYVLPTQIDPLQKIRIYIAEGAFDILGVYYNTEANKNNAIFASIGGKTYAGIVQFFIKNYGFMNFELHIYVDNDINNWEIQKVADLLAPFGIDIYMHRNQYPGEKDYGVRRENIIDRVVKL